MNDPSTFKLHESSDVWGGQWTEKKLDAFGKYLSAYLTIFNDKSYYKTIYFDGFAGTGVRKEKVTNTLYCQLSLTKDEEHVYKGAAERVICLDKSFDYYYFVDRRQSLQKLEARLKALSESAGKKLEFRPDDCNNQLKKLAETMRCGKYVALVLLDPFGMDIEWETIASLKKTKSDIWVLIPTGVIVNRLLDSAGKLKFSSRLESFFGLSESEIRKEFYRTEKLDTLFGESEIVKKIENPINHIACLYIRQMKSIWKFVTEPPLVLYNSRNVPIYHFVFASSNKTGYKIAGDSIKKI